MLSFKQKNLRAISNTKNWLLQTDPSSHRKNCFHASFRLTAVPAPYTVEPTPCSHQKNLFQGIVPWHTEFASPSLGLRARDILSYLETPS